MKQLSPAPNNHPMALPCCTILGEPLFPAFQVPRKYTGELFGLEYLYAQTGKALQTVPDDDKTEDEDDDEGFEVRYFDEYKYNR